MIVSHPTAILILLAILGVTGCRKADLLLAEYSSVGSGRPDGGWVFRFYASGECEAHAANGSLDTVGTYKTNSTGYQIEVRIRPAWKRLILGENSPRKLMLISVRTNGTEFLMDESRYKSYAKTGDTNMLFQEVRRVR